MRPIRHRHYYYNHAWQFLKEHIDEDYQSDPGVNRIGQQFWGINSIDDPIARRVETVGSEDPPTKWFYATDVNNSVRAVLSSTGQIYERVSYDAYGRPTLRFPSDADDNGVVDLFDNTFFLNTLNNGPDISDPDYDPDSDLEGRDGDVDLFDYQAFLALFGRTDHPIDPAAVSDYVGDDAPDSPLGFGSYMYHIELGMYHTRYRWYDPRSGRFLQRDPIGYVDGSNLYLYAMASPWDGLDPMGLKYVPMGLESVDYDTIGGPFSRAYEYYEYNPASGHGMLFNSDGPRGHRWQEILNNEQTRERILQEQREAFQKEVDDWWEDFQESDEYCEIINNPRLRPEAVESQILQHLNNHLTEKAVNAVWNDFYTLAGVEIGTAVGPGAALKGFRLLGGAVRSARGALTAGAAGAGGAAATAAAAPRTAVQILAANKAAGKAAEAAVAKQLVAEGNILMGSQVTVRTSAGRRVIDHLIQTPAGDLVAVEVKAGNATRNASQIAKDRLMATEGCKIIGQNADPSLLGSTRIIPTIVQQVP